MSKPPQSKFSGALAALRNPPADAETKAPAADGMKEQVTEREPEPTTGDAFAIAPVLSRGKGRPPGKRSNADYQPTTVFLRKATKNTAQRRLMDDTEKRDLSELIEQLLSQWVEAQ
jgi:hypothetical protein